MRVLILDTCCGAFLESCEVVTYAGVEDLVQKARHYLAHESGRRTIGAAGQARTLREHSYELRMQEPPEVPRRDVP